MPGTHVYNYDIYKMYKHGESLEDFTPRQVYRALKENLLQVVLVKNADDEEVVFNYVPEDNKFYQII